MHVLYFLIFKTCTIFCQNITTYVMLNCQFSVCNTAYAGINKHKNSLIHLIRIRNIYWPEGICLAPDNHTGQLIMLVATVQRQINIHVQSTVAHTQLQNIHVEQLNKILKTLSIPAYCASVFNFWLLPVYPGARIHITFTTH